MLSFIAELPGGASLTFLEPHVTGDRQVDLPLLWRQRHELKPLAMQFTAFSAVIGRLVVSVPRLPQLWKNTLQALETKLG